MLTIYRPTPTTALYTVSTQSPTQNLASQLTTAFFLAIRLTLATLLCLTLYFESQTFHATSDTDLPAWFPSRAPSSIPTLPWRILIYAVTAYLVLRRRHAEESLLVIQGLGLQTSMSSSSFLWRASTRFIPTSAVQDVFIHEAFRGFEVRFYLCVVVEGEEGVVVVFPVSA